MWTTSRTAKRRSTPPDAPSVGSQQSLFDDWLNPDGGAPNTGWKGPFYVPRGASVQFLPDGFIVQRDGSGPAAERTWKRPSTGDDSGLSTIRYRLGLVNKQLYIVNTLTQVTPGSDTPTIDINSNNIDFSKGLPFTGVMYFEGNVRVRGTIPTDVQLTLVSGATIYIDGPIVKGTTATAATAVSRNGAAVGTVIGGLSKSSLILMAKDNVAVNTTMFFGPKRWPDPRVGERHDGFVSDQPGSLARGGRHRGGADHPPHGPGA